MLVSYPFWVEMIWPAIIYIHVCPLFVRTVMFDFEVNVFFPSFCFSDLFYELRWIFKHKYWVNIKTKLLIIPVIWSAFQLAPSHKRSTSTLTDLKLFCKEKYSTETCSCNVNKSLLFKGLTQEGTIQKNNRFYRFSFGIKVEKCVPFSSHFTHMCYFVLAYQINHNKIHWRLCLWQKRCNTIMKLYNALSFHTSCLCR